MQDRKKFTALLEAYLAGNATNENFRELMQMIKEGSYDELLRQKIDTALFTSDAVNDMEEERAKQLVLNILSAEKETVELITDHQITRRSWLWAAAAVTGIILVLMAALIFPAKKVSKEGFAKSENKILQPKSGTAEKKYIHLQDGSTVLLNEGSRLEYPDSFADKVREVTLIGEGYFDIKHDAKRPFIVHTGKITTTVLGTAFNIKAYPQQKEITVTVTRGRVKVSDDKRTIGIITPNESIAVNTATKVFRQEKVDAEHAVAWKKQYLVLDNISLGDAAVLISNKYHVTISFSKEELKDCRISATFLDNENVEQVLTVVTGVVNARYSSQPNDQVIISGEGCR